MTATPNDPPTPPASDSFKEGIYLEKKMGTIGTGSTAKTAEYRNFWVTGILKDDSVVMVLLNDEFKPTPIKETFRLEVLTGPNWFFIAEGEKKYQRLRPLLDQLLAPKKAAAPIASTAAANWWGGASPTGGSPANMFELKKSAPPKESAQKKGGWWNK